MKDIKSFYKKALREAGIKAEPGSGRKLGHMKIAELHTLYIESGLNDMKDEKSFYKKALRAAGIKAEPGSGRKFGHMKIAELRTLYIESVLNEK